MAGVGERADDEEDGVKVTIKGDENIRAFGGLATALKTPFRDPVCGRTMDTLYAYEYHLYMRPECRQDIDEDVIRRIRAHFDGER